MKVELLDKMGSDSSVVNAARVSFAKDASQFTDAQNDKLIKYLATHGHWSPFAHAFLQFRISAPIFVARQLVKHQVGLSWNEVSRRYVDDTPTFYDPGVWRARPTGGAKQGSSEQEVYTLRKKMGGIITVKGAVERLHEHALELYDEMISVGVAPEQARMILPQSMMTEWVWSGSLHAFIRVCKERLHPHSQKETQEIAQQIAVFTKESFPISWDALNDCT